MAAVLNSSGQGKGSGIITLPLILLVTMMALLTSCKSDPGQAASFKTIFDHYRDQGGIVAISFPPGLLGLFLSDSDPDQAELKELMQDLSSFQMLYLAEGSPDATLLSNLKSDVSSFTYRNEFQDLFRIQNSEEDIVIRILEKDNIVHEAVLMLNGGDGIYVIDLRGNISTGLFTRLAESGSLKAFTDLSRIDL